MSQFAQLPEVYVNESGQNFVEPVFMLTADGYYGESAWQEGDRIVWMETPNHTMQPLNRAAGEAIQAWQESLPLKGESVQQADLEEAIRFLPKAELEKLEGPAYHDTVFRTAVAIKHRRENKPGLMLPSFTVRSAGGSAAPPMPNAAIASLRDGPQGFGEARAPQRASQNRSARTTKPMGNAPDAAAPPV